MAQTLGTCAGSIRACAETGARLRGRVGIGPGIVEGFVRQGSAVTFIDMLDKESRALAERTGAWFEKVDLKDIAADQVASGGWSSAAGAFDVLVNNAANDDATRSPGHEEIGMTGST